MSRAQITRLADVGRVELGSKSYDVSSYLDGQPSVTLALFQLPGANALATAESIRAEMERLAERFPPGMEYRIVYDTTVFVNESVHEVYKTLIEAFILVFLVVLIFLQDWRATLLPMIDVPVSLVGTLAVMSVLGLLAQQPVALRPRARHRHRRRRRHRGGRERGALDGAGAARRARRPSRRSTRSPVP